MTKTFTSIFQHIFCYLKTEYNSCLLRWKTKLPEYFNFSSFRRILMFEGQGLHNTFSCCSLNHLHVPINVIIFSPTLPLLPALGFFPVYCLGFLAISFAYLNLSLQSCPACSGAHTYTRGVKRERGGG